MGNRPISAHELSPKTQQLITTGKNKMPRSAQLCPEPVILWVTFARTKMSLYLFLILPLPT